MEPSVVAGSSNLEPRDDMEFDSHEAAYEFYKEYAKSVGFGTAKLSSRRSRASKEFIDAKFSCIRYGNKQQSDDAINPRPSPKIGCKASMHVKRRQSGKWYIHSFVKEHNHELLPAQVHLFRSHRNGDPLKNDPKVRRKKALAAVSNHYGTYQFSSSLENVFRSQHDRGRNLALEEGDAQMLLEFFVHMQEENPEFFYAIDLNEEHRLRNVFWVDAKGMEDYANFGDVVSLDISYFSNKHKIPLVFFIGVNNHIHPTLMGCALIVDESVHTFLWLLRTWCLAMGGRGPRVLLTDQNNAIKAAVSAVLPNTHHYFNLWCILEKIQDLIFREDEWIQSLHEDRKRWVPTFIRDVSFAGLSTASRAESFLCRHAIVVLQMSGVFRIPIKYILQRWSNIAKSRLPISERLDEVQAKVRCYNDLCRRAIILGEEGSLSQESYNIAVSAIKEAIRQCAAANGPTQTDLRPPGMPATLAIQGVEEANHNSTAVAREQVSNIKVTQTSRGTKRVDSGNEKESNESCANKKGKVPLEPEVTNLGTQGVFHQMDMPGSLDYPTYYPRFLTTLLRGGEINKRNVELLGEMLEEQS
nr:protein FAR1-RELATED SEQUENCE 4 isoform X1 [Ipomoea batatas]